MFCFCLRQPQLDRAGWLGTGYVDQANPKLKSICLCLCPCPCLCLCLPRLKVCWEYLQESTITCPWKLCEYGLLKEWDGEKKTITSFLSKDKTICWGSLFYIDKLLLFQKYYILSSCHLLCSIWDFSNNWYW